MSGGGGIIIIRAKNGTNPWTEESLSCSDLALLIASLPNSTENAALIAKLEAVQAAGGC